MSPDTRSSDLDTQERAVKRRCVRKACNSCRARKSKCDGVEPICGTCRRKNLGCVYAASTNEKWANMEANNRRLQAELGSALTRIEDLERHSASSSQTATGLMEMHDTLETATNQSPRDAGYNLPHRLTRPSGHAQSGLDGTYLNSAYTLLDKLTNASDQESAAILARMRWSRSWEYVAAGIFSRTRSPSFTPANPVDSLSRPPAPESGGPSIRPDHSLSSSSAVALPINYALESSSYPGAAISYGFDREIWLRSHDEESDASLVVARRHGLRGQSTFANIAFSPNARFGNLPFSSSLASNGYPSEVQAKQKGNLFASPWEIRIANFVGPADNDPIHCIHQSMIRTIQSAGENVEAFCGPHPYLKALDDDVDFQKAPRLSQIVATVVRSIKPDEKAPNMTQYGTMWACWALWKWMLAPSPATFNSIPDHLRPTPAQLFAPHPLVFDFVGFPALRDAICQLNRPPYRWLTQACVTVQCKEPISPIPLFKQHAVTGEIDINPMCKVHVGRPENWSLGASVKSSLKDLDKYVELRPDT